MNGGEKADAGGGEERIEEQVAETVVDRTLAVFTSAGAAVAEEVGDVIVEMTEGDLRTEGFGTAFHGFGEGRGVAVAARTADENEEFRDLGHAGRQRQLPCHPGSGETLSLIHL